MAAWALRDSGNTDRRGFGSRLSQPASPIGVLRCISYNGLILQPRSGVNSSFFRLLLSKSSGSFLLPIPKTRKARELVMLLARIRSAVLFLGRPDGWNDVSVTAGEVSRGFSGGSSSQHKNQLVPLEDPPEKTATPAGSLGQPRASGHERVLNGTTTCGGAYCHHPEVTTRQRWWRSGLPRSRVFCTTSVMLKILTFSIQTLSIMTRCAKKPS